MCAYIHTIVDSILRRINITNNHTSLVIVIYLYGRVDRYPLVILHYICTVYLCIIHLIIICTNMHHRTTSGEDLFIYSPDAARWSLPWKHIAYTFFNVSSEVFTNKKPTMVSIAPAAPNKEPEPGA